MSILKDLDPEYARLVTDPAAKKREGMGLVMPTALLSLSTLLLLAALFYGQEAIPRPGAYAPPAAATPTPIFVSKAETPPATSTAKVAPPEVLPNESPEEASKAQSNPLLALEDAPSAGPLVAKTAENPAKPKHSKTAVKATAKKLALNKTEKRQRKSHEDPPLRRDVDIITAIMR